VGYLVKPYGQIHACCVAGISAMFALSAYNASHAQLQYTHRCFVYEVTCATLHEFAERITDDEAELTEYLSSTVL